MGINGLLEKKPKFTSQKNTVIQFFLVKKVAKIKIMLQNENFFCNNNETKKHFQEFLAFSIFFCTFLIIKKISPLCKDKQDSTLFFVNSHSQIRGAQIFKAICINISKF